MSCEIFWVEIVFFAEGWAVGDDYGHVYVVLPAVQEEADVGDN